MKSSPEKDMKEFSWFLFFLIENRMDLEWPMKFWDSYIYWAKFRGIYVSSFHYYYASVRNHITRYLPQEDVTMSFELQSGYGLHIFWCGFKFILISYCLVRVYKDTIEFPLLILYYILPPGKTDLWVQYLFLCIS